jgi:iron complex outermembrane receptor protein
LPGGGSVLYGDGASGGTINIITKQASKNTGSISIASGSYDSKDIQANSDIVSGNTSIRLFGRHAESDGYRDNSASRQDVFGLDGQVIREQQTWFLSAQASQSDNRLASERKVNPSLNIDELHNTPKGTRTPDDYAEDNRYQIWGGWKLAFNKNVELIIDGSKRYKTQHSFYGDYIPNDFYDDNRYTNTRLITDAITPRLLVNYTTGSIENTVRTGIDWYQTDYLSYRGQQATSAPIHTITIDSESRSAYLLQSSRFEQTTVNRRCA